jgi:hypothetical protein
MLYLNSGVLVLVLALSLAPLVVPWGKWFAYLLFLFVLVEAALVALVFAELGAPDADGPAIIGVGLLPFVSPVLFAASTTCRLACKGVVSFIGAAHRK